MKRILSVVSVLFPLLLNAQSLNDITFGDNNSLEVITWNLENFPTKGNATIDSVSRIVQALNADIIALQEIWEEDDFDQLMETLPGFDGFYDPFYLGGLAYIYKENSIEILDAYEIYATSEYWNALPRAPFIIEFLFNGNTFYCINNHLKCCGDGFFETNNEDDEENRRFTGMNLVKDYIDEVLPNESVFIVGDLNDVLTDPEQHNVFQKFFNDSENYTFADMEIAESSSANWSYPSWPSHLDHILITNELFEAFEDNNSNVSTINIDDFLIGGFNAYKNRISDHLPVGVKLDASIISSSAPTISNERKITIFPNPSYGLLQFNRSFEKQSYSVFDNLGKLVHTGEITGRTIDLSILLRDGIYTIVFHNTDDNFHATSRFVIGN